MKYQLLENKIVAFKQDDIITRQEGYAPQGEWLETERNIVILNGVFYFEDDEKYISEKNKQQAEAQAIAEAEALKPTTEDLVEALDILSAIVLGGE